MVSKYLLETELYLSAESHRWCVTVVERVSALGFVNTIIAHDSCSFPIILQVISKTSPYYLPSNALTLHPMYFYSKIFLLWNVYIYRIMQHDETLCSQLPGCYCLCLELWVWSSHLHVKESKKGVSLVVQMVKNLPAMQESLVPTLGPKDSLGKGIATHSSILAWRIPGREEPGGLQPMYSLLASLWPLWEFAQLLEGTDFHSCFYSGWSLHWMRITTLSTS